MGLAAGDGLKEVRNKTQRGVADLQEPAKEGSKMKKMMWVAIVVAVAVMSCDYDDGEVSAPVTPELWVSGAGQSVDDKLTVCVSVQRRYGEHVSDAFVTLNGSLLIYDGNRQGYYLTDTLYIRPGDDVVLEVRHESTVVSCALTMPEEPVIQSPTLAKSPYDAGLAIPVQWEAFSATPNLLYVRSRESLAFSGADLSGDGIGWGSLVDSALTETSIPAGTFLTSERQLSGTDTNVVVVPINQFESSSAEAYLNMTIGNPVMGSFTTAGL